MKSFSKIEDQYLSEIGKLRMERLNLLGLSDDQNLVSPEEEIFKKWLGNERFDELITYYTTEYGGITKTGFNWWDKIQKELIKNGDVKRLHHLFRRLIPDLLKSYRFHANFAKEKDWEDTLTTGAMVRVAKLKAEILQIFWAYFNSMHELGEKQVADTLLDEIRCLYLDKKRKIPKPIDKKVTKEVFWEMIFDSKNIDPLKGFIATLEIKLTELKISEIKKFHKLLMEFMDNLWSWDLWALAFIGRGGCSDDAFEYFRAWIISQGKKSYDAAVKGPEELIQVVTLDSDLQCEELLYVASNAYYNRQGKEMPEIKYPKVVPKGKEWKEEDLKTRYSNLWQIFREKG